MRRYLIATSVVCSLLWAVCGMSALAVALHEHVDHAEPHDHHDVIRTVLHGHSHEGTPDHDHELSTLVGASRGSATPHNQDPASQSPDTEHYRGSSLRVGGATEPCAPDVGQPLYVMHCVLLT
jgi:hypothetical protein